MAKRIVDTLSWLQLRVEDASASVAGLATLAALVLETSNVIARYLLNSPISGTYATTERVFMIAMVWLAAARVQRLRRHIAVDLAVRGLGRRGRLTLQLLPWMMGIVLWGFVAQATFKLGLDRWSSVEFGTIFPTRSGLPWLIVSAGSALLSLRLLSDVLGELLGGRSLAEDKEGREETRLA